MIPFVFFYIKLIILQYVMAPVHQNTHQFHVKKLKTNIESHRMIILCSFHSVNSEFVSEYRPSVILLVSPEINYIYTLIWVGELNIIIAMK